LSLSQGVPDGQLGAQAGRAHVLAVHTWVMQSLAAPQLLPVVQLGAQGGGWQ
jgi:hypothetical protein